MHGIETVLYLSIGGLFTIGYVYDSNTIIYILKLSKKLLIFFDSGIYKTPI